MKHYTTKSLKAFEPVEALPKKQYTDKEKLLLALQQRAVKLTYQKKQLFCTLDPRWMSKCRRENDLKMARRVNAKSEGSLTIFDIKANFFRYFKLDRLAAAVVLRESRKGAA